MPKYTKIHFNYRKEISDYSDLVEILFPGNRNQQHAAACVLFELKWSESIIQPSLNFAGTNAIGWERFETDYFPVINLSRPETIEHECYILGSLCTPHDVWGYSYWGKDIQPGDVLMIPTQGAYTYSLRQEFIKPLPEVVMLDNNYSP